MKTSTGILLSIVIVSYRNEKVLRDCLESVQKQNDIGESLEVIVVEQSPENTIYNNLLSEHPEVMVLRNENKGFGAGNNCGAGCARGKYLLFLNPDTILVEPVFKYALQQFERYPKVGLFGVRLVSKDGNNNKSFHFRKPYGLTRLVLWRFFDKTNIFLPDKMYIAGADLFVRRDAFKMVGCFDEAMFMYYEETDLCDRLNQSGFDIAFFPEKKIVHLEGRSSVGENVFRQQLDSLKHYCLKNSKSYTDYLKHMYRDRRMKMIFGLGDTTAAARETQILKEQLPSNDVGVKL